MASYIPHPEAFVHNFLQVIDIILEIGQNKNTLAVLTRTISNLSFLWYNLRLAGDAQINCCLKITLKFG
jgi:hypothetical protein